MGGEDRLDRMEVEIREIKQLLLTMSADTRKMSTHIDNVQGFIARVKSFMSKFAHLG